MSVDLFGHVARVDDGVRSAFDFYETPSWMVRSLLHYHPSIAGTRVLECASGNDAIANVLREEYGCEVFTNDIDPRHPAQTHHDAATDAYWRQAPEVEWVISNLPFDVAFDVLTRAVAHARFGVAFLLRKTFLEPTKDRRRVRRGLIARGPWLALHPPTREIGLPRHKFRGDGSDTVACDWMLWERVPDPQFTRAREIDHLAKTRMRARR
jgi:hypothetical protein